MTKLILCLLLVITYVFCSSRYLDGDFEYKFVSPVYEKCCNMTHFSFCCGDTITIGATIIYDNDNLPLVIQFSGTSNSTYGFFSNGNFLFEFYGNTKVSALDENEKIRLSVLCDNRNITREIGLDKEYVSYYQTRRVITKILFVLFFIAIACFLFVIIVGVCGFAWALCFNLYYFLRKRYRKRLNNNYDNLSDENSNNSTIVDEKLGINNKNRLWFCL